MHAYSLYLDSPEESLDQTNTYDAIEAIQAFLNRYPRSKYREEGTNIIDELQQKLELKAYENALQYYKLEKYHGGDALKASLIAFDNFTKDFPDSDYNDHISYLKVECSYKLAKKSIRSRQRERLNDTIEYYNEFINDYPESKNISEAENLYEACLDDLEKLTKNNL